VGVVLREHSCVVAGSSSSVLLLTLLTHKVVAGDSLLDQPACLSHLLCVRRDVVQVQTHLFIPTLFSVALQQKSVR